MFRSISVCSPDLNGLKKFWIMQLHCLKDIKKYFQAEFFHQICCLSFNSIAKSAEKQLSFRELSESRELTVLYLFSNFENKVLKSPKMVYCFWGAENADSDLSGHQRMTIHFLCPKNGLPFLRTTHRSWAPREHAVFSGRWEQQFSTCSWRQRTVFSAPIEAVASIETLGVRDIARSYRMTVWSKGALR